MGAKVNIKLGLVMARALVVNGWCQYNYAISTNGVSVPPESDDAVAFSAEGAIRRTLGAGSRGVREAMRMLDHYSGYPEFSAGGIDTINRWQPPRLDWVLEVFDEAIAQYDRWQLK